MSIAPPLLSLLATACVTTYQLPPAPGPSAPASSPSVPAALPDLVPRMQASRRIAVQPVLFVPRGANPFDEAQAARLIGEHLALARAHYQEVLGTTFDVVDGPPAVYRARHADAHYLDAPEDTPDDRAHRMLAELFAWRGTDRYSTDVVFLAIYVSSGRPIWAGARTFNGAPGTGGGYVEMDLASLVSDRPYRFQSTLVHELGHAFGLTHVTCAGLDLATSPSIMSGNAAHWSTGLSRSATPGGFLPYERQQLAYASRVLPGLVADTGAVDADALQRCFLPPMSETVGRYVDLPGVGFELYYDGQRVNGPDASLYWRAQAESSCEQSRRLPGVRVECRYNGRPM